MKTNKTEESREIGELISEIIESGWIVLKFDQMKDWIVQAENPALYEEDSECDEWLITRHGTLTESLANIVDTIRRYNGEPTLQEEVSEMLAADAQHETLPPIVTGPDAACRCGSQKPLKLERKYNLLVSWLDGFPIYDHSWFGKVKPGEILTCQDCGKNYSLGERQN